MQKVVVLNNKQIIDYENIGNKIESNELVREIMKDIPFFDESKGGVTLSGGEPLVQFEFVNEVIKLFKENEINIAILDILMPVLSGIDLLKKIKKKCPKVDVIMISGHASIDVAVKAMKLGAFDFIEKPPSLNKLVSMVNRILELQKKSTG